MLSSQSSLRQVITLTTRLAAWAQLAAAALPGDPHSIVLQEQLQQQGAADSKRPGSNSRRVHAAGACSLSIDPLASWTWSLTSAAGGGSGLRWPGSTSRRQQQQDDEGDAGMLGTCVVVVLQEVGSLAGSVHRRFMSSLVSSDAMQD